MLRQGSADAWPTRFGGKWATGHLALAHSTPTLGLLPGSAATLLQNWSGGDVRETRYGGPTRFLLRQGSADAWPTRSAVSGPQVTWPWRTPPNWFWPAEFMFCLLDKRIISLQTFLRAFACSFCTLDDPSKHLDIEILSGTYMGRICMAYLGVFCVPPLALFVRVGVLPRIICLRRSSETPTASATQIVKACMGSV